MKNTLINLIQYNDNITNKIISTRHDISDVPFKGHIEVLNTILFGLKFYEEKYQQELDNLTQKVNNGDLELNSLEFNEIRKNINDKYFAQLKATATFNQTSAILSNWRMNESIIDHFTDDVIKTPENVKITPQSLVDLLPNY